MADGHVWNESDEDVLERKLAEIAPCIGRLVIAFTGLEDCVNGYLVDTLNENCPEIGLTVIANMSYVAKVELFGKLRNDLENRVMQNRFEIGGYF